jgi:excisionase family DNA binding protein
MALLLKTHEVAAELATSESNVRKLIARGVIPSIKLGHLRRVRRGDLEAYIAGIPLAARSPVPAPFLTQLWESEGEQPNLSAVLPARSGQKRPQPASAEVGS